MLLHNRTGDRETQTGAFTGVFGSEKWFENLSDFFRLGCRGLGQ